MKLRFAIWELGPAIYLDEAARGEILERWGRIPRLSILVNEGSVEVHRSADGVYMVPSSEHDMDDWPFRINQEHGREGARCGVCELNFYWIGNHLEASLPLPHLLQWPRYQEFADGTFDKHAAVIREIRLRQESLQHHVGKRELAIPAAVQKLLTPQERVRYFQEFTI